MMSAYLIGQINVKDEQLWQEYVQGVKTSLYEVEANILFRGKKSGVLAGENPSSLVVVISFKNQDELNAWFHSDKYQSLIELRDKAADVTITTYEDYL